MRRIYERFGISEGQATTTSYAPVETGAVGAAAVPDDLSTLDDHTSDTLNV